MTISWGAVCRAKQGQPVSGDVYLVHEYAPGMLLATVIDGLGGGEEAAHAALLARQVLLQFPDYPLQELLRRAHTALHATRGAVIGLLRLEQAQHLALYTGVGNIGVQVYSRQPIKPISKNGILGFRLPTLLELRYAYDPGDIFVLYSDGISGGFAQDGTIDLKQPPQRMAEQLLAGYGKLSDDATAVVIKTTERP
ncbi:MAG TPA: SpoIIE family protein phosphatase [Kouleothrix sp.]|uniref:SpoIIE family protein phosphatase n=1 Tax=Kouleothrix sp. TaxID=2779161 RepID=UPI002C7B0C6B|nr:SpoIIE family protein phosphatase [Kouleothrix sp.]HRC74625.1 SpoIIE family protein phosphatase [Kouleothrix sp.]